MQDNENNLADSVQDDIDRASDLARAGKDIYDRIQGDSGGNQRLRNLLRTGSLDGGMKTGQHAATSAGAGGAGSGAAGQMSTDAAAAVGSEAAQTAVQAGAGAAEATGAGAAAGTAVAPGPGTAVGAIAGAAAGLLVKPLVRAVIVIIVFLTMVFASLPSAFFEDDIDMIDNAGPVARYQQYHQMLGDRFNTSLEETLLEIEEDMPNQLSFDDYDEVNYFYNLIPPKERLLAEFLDSSNLIISLFEISTDNWRKATFAHFESAIDKNSLWSGIIDYSFTGDYTTETDTRVEWDSDKDEWVTIHIINVTMDYLVTDMSVSVFRNEFTVEEKYFIKAVEMAYNMKVYFEGADALPPGGVLPGEGGSYIGGNTHQAIRTAIAGLAEDLEFFGGSCGMPLPSGVWTVSSEFGPRNYAPDPIHTGIDFACDEGTEIYAVMDGIVLLKLTNNKSFGNHIVIYHGGKISTMYAHMIRFNNSLSVGDRVSAGDVVGYVGRTGLSTGDHLHFEYQINGNAHNPRAYLPI